MPDGKNLTRLLQGPVEYSDYGGIGFRSTRIVMR